VFTKRGNSLTFLASGESVVFVVWVQGVGGQPTEASADEPRSEEDFGSVGVYAKSHLLWASKIFSGLEVLPGLSLGQSYGLYSGWCLCLLPAAGGLSRQTSNLVSWQPGRSPVWHFVLWGANALAQQVPTWLYGGGALQGRCHVGCVRTRQGVDFQALLRVPPCTPRLRNATDGPRTHFGDSLG